MHRDGEVPRGEIVPEIAGVLVTGDPRLHAVCRVDAWVAPVDAPLRPGAASRPRALRLAVRLAHAWSPGLSPLSTARLSWMRSVGGDESGTAVTGAMGRAR